ncbi:hypothetical protein OKW47_003504 [Paraburkholderia atlantica]
MTRRGRMQRFDADRYFDAERFQKSVASKRQIRRSVAEEGARGIAGRDLEEGFCDREMGRVPCKADSSPVQVAANVAHMAQNDQVNRAQLIAIG